MKKLVFCLSVIGVVAAGTATGYAGKPGSCCTPGACAMGMSKATTQNVEVRQGRAGSEIVSVQTTTQGRIVRGGGTTTLAAAADSTATRSSGMGGRMQ